MPQAGEHTVRTMIRPYRPEDFEPLYEIDQACYPPGIAYSRRTLRAFLRLPGVECLIAEVNGEVVGFILAEQEGPHAHLITIDVCEPHRRRGIGTALLAVIERTLARHGVRALELETATNNQPAIAFWQKHGYRTLGVLRRYYLNRIDALFMRKLLVPTKET